MLQLITKHVTKYVTKVEPTLTVTVNSNDRLKAHIEARRPGDGSNVPVEQQTNHQNVLGNHFSIKLDASVMNSYNSSCPRN